MRTAVRTLTLNVYKVDYAPMRRFILDRSAVPYFSNLAWFLRDKVPCRHCSAFAARGCLWQRVAWPHMCAA